ncbi:putative HEM12-uroporphyrinogen decarboxylase [Microstroma glucosiphilum]|uniref:Uroporphyrinogen decarboxylase n=1 Tax=Pseudomicrostroma glucosiphilum TaxID=1684307 RepID=A0A316U376_9BASI|nr:putative HEM12-uroporphyrinogen decarboxylase [Pseudomicrostroma glucosiphilum]PWN19254.1 putative HEM12-uroporphyrinogen decarboxylase [Pseudomicrostroma glucosiphilum]
MVNPILTHLNSFTARKQDEMCKTGQFPGLRNDLILRAARGQHTERAPVWIMRQAGRYLPEFRKLRESHDFFTCCRTPSLACEITLQPIRRYSGLLDAAIIFSDILVVPQAMGLEVEMLPQKGPHFPDPLETPKDMDRLHKKIDVNKELGYVYEAITMTRKELAGEVPLIGFCGAPWTLMAYMIEGGGSKGFEKAKRWLFDYPEESKVLLQKIADVCADFLVGQVKAGAQMVQVFDSWAGELSPANFRTFSLPYLRSIASTVNERLACSSTACVPMIIFAKGALGHSLPEISRAGYDVVALDWTVEPAVARRVVDLATPGSAAKISKGAADNEAAHRIALQGNMDPSVLYASKEAIEKEVERMLRSKKGGFGGEGAYIANLGHGITPGVDPENLKAYLKAIHRISREINSEKGDE